MGALFETYVCKTDFLTITGPISRPESVKIVPPQKSRIFAVKRIVWAEKWAPKELAVRG